MRAKYFLKIRHEILIKIDHNNFEVSNSNCNRNRKTKFDFIPIERLQLSLWQHLIISVIGSFKLMLGIEIVYSNDPDTHEAAHAFIWFFWLSLIDLNLNFVVYILNYFLAFRIPADLTKSI